MVAGCSWATECTPHANESRCPGRLLTTAMNTWFDWRDNERGSYDFRFANAEPPPETTRLRILIDAGAPLVALAA